MARKCSSLVWDLLVLYKDPGFNPLHHINQLLWCMPTRGKRQEDQKFQVILSYIVSSGPALVTQDTVSKESNPVVGT